MGDNNTTAINAVKHKINSVQSGAREALDTAETDLHAKITATQLLGTHESLGEASRARVAIFDSCPSAQSCPLPGYA